MNWKAIAGSIIFVLILLASSNFVNWKLTSKAYYKDGQNSVIQDSVKTDTLTVIKIDTFYINIHHYIKAKVDTVGEVVFYSAKTDTVIIENQDTLAIIKEEITFNEGIFEVLMDIEIRPVEKLVEITKTVFRTAMVEVPADPPFYNTFWFGTVFTIIAAVLLAIFL